MDEIGVTAAPEPGIKIITEKQCFSRIGMAYFVMTAITIGLQLVGGVVLVLAAPEAGVGSWQFWAASFIPMYCVAVPACIAMMRRVPSRAPETHRLGCGRFWVCLLMCIGIMYTGNLIGVCLMNLVGALRGAPVDSSLDLMLENSSLFMNFLVTVLLAPAIEELLFRKLLIDRTRQFGEGLAVVLSGVLFGLFHGNFYQFFYACGLGFLLAYLYVRTGRLRYPVALHMIINFMGAVIAPLVLRVTERLDLEDPAAVLQVLPQMLWVSLYGFAILGSAVAGVVLVIVNIKKFRVGAGECPLPRGHRFGTVFGNVGMILFLVSIVCMFVFNFI